MQFLNIGPAEMILVLVLALIVFGPGKLPEIGRAVGKSIGEFRRATSDLTREFSQSIDEVKQPFDEMKGAFTGAADAVAAPVGTGLVCPSCSASNPTSNKFCRECGTRLLPEEESVDCPACSAANPVSNKFCRECGASMPVLVVETPAVVSAETPVDESAVVVTTAAAYDTVGEAEAADETPSTSEPEAESPLPAVDTAAPEPQQPEEEIPYIEPETPEAPPEQVGEKVR